MRKEQLAEDLEREKEKLRLKLDSANLEDNVVHVGKHERVASEAMVRVKVGDWDESGDNEIASSTANLLESVLREAESSEATRREKRDDRSVRATRAACVCRMYC